jgi:hypothetical protein
MIKLEPETKTAAEAPAAMAAMAIPPTVKPSPKRIPTSVAISIN